MIEEPGWADLFEEPAERLLEEWTEGLARNPASPDDGWVAKLPSTP